MADSGGRGRARGRAAGRSRGRARDTAAQRPGTAESGPPPAQSQQYQQHAPPPQSQQYQQHAQSQQYQQHAPPPQSQQYQQQQQQRPPSQQMQQQQRPPSQQMQGAAGGDAPAPGGGRANYRGSRAGRPGADSSAGAGAALEQQFQQLEVRGERQERERRSRFVDGNFRPEALTTKKGESGTRMDLAGNFFKLNYAPDWHLYQYHVDFRPACESRKLKGALLSNHQNILGGVRAFDGTILFLPHRLPDDETVVYSNRRHDDQNVKITIKLTNEIPPRSFQCLQVMNIIWRRIQGMMGMTQINRHYFHMDQGIDVPKHHLKVMPGFQTSILQYETDVLLEIDIAHKILRTESVLEQMYGIYNRSRGDFHNQASRAIVGTIVLTRYNNKTYSVDDIDWDKRVTDTFDKSNGSKVSYRDYYKAQYDVEITDMDQPMLVSRPKKSDIRRGQTGLIYLVPELCVVTGLTEAARSDFSLMKDVAAHTRINPDIRANRLADFMQAVKKHPQVAAEMANWNLRFEDRLERIVGRQLPREDIVMGRDVKLGYKQDEADWSRDMRGKQMRSSVELANWVMVFPRQCEQGAREMVNLLYQVGPPMGMRIREPRMVQINNDRNESYMEALRTQVGRDAQMAFVVLSNNKKDRYDALKKWLCIDAPVPSQMVLAKTLNNKNLMSVATKIAIQMNCKMGGVVWAVPIPVKNVMVVGIDTYHDSSRKGRSCGGIVASTNADFTRFYSTVTFQMTHLELQDKLRTSMTSCLKAFFEKNGVLPEKIIVYRDGVGDGQLDAVAEHELPQVRDALRAGIGQDYQPRLAYIVVKKRINARFFRMTQQGGRGGGCSNPPPGTVVDDVATKHCWYDFFLISQSVRQGTVGPTHYNIILDEIGMKPDHYQRLSYKLCHMYFNWQGTIRVPAPCMYAHKLAFLCGQSLHRDFHPVLADRLFFL